MHKYDEMHVRRYAVLKEYCQRYIPNSNSKILDVGPSHFTRYLAETYRHVDALGLERHKDLFSEFALPSEHFIPFDMSYAQFSDHWIPLDKYDAIIFAEVIEHLFCPPESSLAFLASALQDGGVIICQTPNGLSLEKRLRMLFGYPPFDRKSARHYREFGKNELVEAGECAGLTIIHHEFKDYFGIGGGMMKKTAGKLLHGIGYVAPHLRRGQTAVFRKLPQQHLGPENVSQ